MIFTDIIGLDIFQYFFGIFIRWNILITVEVGKSYLAFLCLFFIEG